MQKKLFTLNPVLADYLFPTLLTETTTQASKKTSKTFCHCCYKASRNSNNPNNPNNPNLGGGIRDEKPHVSTFAGTANMMALSEFEPGSDESQLTLW